MAAAVLGRAVLGRSPLGYGRHRGSAPAPVPPADLVEAFVLCLSGLVGTESSKRPLRWFGFDLAPPRTPLPYASCNEPAATDRLLDTSGTKESRGSVEIQVFAATKIQARTLSKQVRSLLEARFLAGALTFAEGHLHWLLATSGGTIRDPDPAPGGGNCFCHTCQFEYRFSYAMGQ